MSSGKRVELTPGLLLLLLLLSLRQQLRLPLLLPSPTPSGQQDSLTPVASAHAPVTAGYYGTLIGRLETHHHEASGEVYAIDESSIFVRGFSYDGTGPDAYFWAGSSVRPDASGFIIPDEKGS